LSKIAHRRGGSRKKAQHSMRGGGLDGQKEGGGAAMKTAKHPGERKKTSKAPHHSFPDGEGKRHNMYKKEKRGAVEGLKKGPKEDLKAGGEKGAGQKALPEKRNSRRVGGKGAVPKGKFANTRGGWPRRKKGISRTPRGEKRRTRGEEGVRQSCSQTPHNKKGHVSQKGGGRKEAPPLERNKCGKKPPGRGRTH